MEDHFKTQSISRLTTIAGISLIIGGLLLWCYFSSGTIVSSAGFFYSIVIIFGVGLVCGLLDILFINILPNHRRISGAMGVAGLSCCLLACVLMMFLRLADSGSWRVILNMARFIGVIVSITALLRASFNLKLSKATDAVFPNGAPGDNSDPGFEDNNASLESDKPNIDYDNVVEVEVEDVPDDKHQA